MPCSGQNLSHRAAACCMFHQRHLMMGNRPTLVLPVLVRNSIALFRGRHQLCDCSRSFRFRTICGASVLCRSPCSIVQGENCQVKRVKCHRLRLRREVGLVHIDRKVARDLLLPHGALGFLGGFTLLQDSRQLLPTSMVIGEDLVNHSELFW